MTDFQQVLKFASEKCVIDFTEYLTKLFSSGNPRKEKKLKTWILCSYMRLSLAKLLNKHETTVTKSIKKDQLSWYNIAIAKLSHYQIILFARINFLLLWCLYEWIRPELLCSLIIISHKYGAE